MCGGMSLSTGFLCAAWTAADRTGQDITSHQFCLILPPAVALDGLLQMCMPVIPKLRRGVAGYFKILLFLSLHVVLLFQMATKLLGQTAIVTFIVAPCISMIQLFSYANLCTCGYIITSLKHLIHLMAPTCFDTQRVVIRELHFPG
jgi:hypothetical protein